VFGGYLGTVMAHFVIDAGLWRMRDPLARRFVSACLPYLVPAAPAAPPAAGPAAPPAAGPPTPAADAAVLTPPPMDRHPI